MVTHSIFGDEIPHGKVHRRLETDFLDDSSLPSWVSSWGGSTTIRHHDIANGRGELEIEVANGAGGFNLPQIDTQTFREVRLGMAFRTDLSGYNIIGTGFVDTTGEPGSANNGAQWFEKATEDWFTIANKENGTATQTDGNFPVLTGDPVVVEHRIRPFENGVTLLAGGGDQVIYSDTNAAYGVPKYYPKVFINTAQESTTESIYLSKLWLDVFHN